MDHLPILPIYDLDAESENSRPPAPYLEVTVEQASLLWWRVAKWQIKTLDFSGSASLAYHLFRNMHDPPTTWDWGSSTQSVSWDYLGENGPLAGWSLKSESGIAMPPDETICGKFKAKGSSILLPADFEEESEFDYSASEAEGWDSYSAECSTNRVDEYVPFPDRLRSPYYVTQEIGDAFFRLRSDPTRIYFAPSRFMACLIGSMGLPTVDLYVETVNDDLTLDFCPSGYRHPLTDESYAAEIYEEEGVWHEQGESILWLPDTGTGKIYLGDNAPAIEFQTFARQKLRRSGYYFYSNPAPPPSATVNVSFDFEMSPEPYYTFNGLYDEDTGERV